MLYNVQEINSFVNEIVIFMLFSTVVVTGYGTNVLENNGSLTSFKTTVTFWLVVRRISFRELFVSAIKLTNYHTAHKT